MTRLISSIILTIISMLSTAAHDPATVRTKQVRAVTNYAGKHLPCPRSHALELK